MRFFKDGPDMPDLLLERRDQGRVVFLCGAGISLDAGMPTFFELTKHVIDFFDPPEGSQIAISFQPWADETEEPKVPLDQIMHLLYQEYGREDVCSLVTQRLQVVDLVNVKSREHEIIAKISSDQIGNPQIVTTNFDLLFEHLKLKCNIESFYEPPAFPEIKLGVSLKGVTYLHGRLQKSDALIFPYILSSADFGRAYLSEAWATNFVRSLLESYTVVLVGYQAEDPPVKYLLQGLNHDGKSDRSKLYAFDKGAPEEIEAKWRDKGVTAIAYKDHRLLWESLDAWANRSDDPRKWRSDLIKLAKKSPREFSAHQRGQVVHTLKTIPGAKLFASITPPPPADWLCVLDARVRTGDGESALDFIAQYELDGDFERRTDSNSNALTYKENILEWRPGDQNPTTPHNLSNFVVIGQEAMPSRLIYLTGWLVKHLDSPVVAWWALKQNRLHPGLIEEVKRELARNQNLHSNGRKTWSLILEYQLDSRNFSWDEGWFRINDKIQADGWDTGILLDFNRLTMPMLSHTFSATPTPPLGSWTDTSFNDLTRWKIKFPKLHGDELTIPDDYLLPCFRVLQENLIKASYWLDYLEVDFFQTPTCYPGRDVEGQEFSRESYQNFRWFLGLFNKVAKKFPIEARIYSLSWSVLDKFYFRKLRLFSLSKDELFEANEVAKFLIDLDQNIFWDIDVRRELLFLVSDRWENISIIYREKLFDRFLGGPDDNIHWNDDFISQKSKLACRYTQWLSFKGKTFSQDQARRLNDKKLDLKEWKDSWAESIVTDYHGSFGSVSIDESPDSIVELPVDEIVDHVIGTRRDGSKTYTERRPFVGLVKINPRKALAALSLSAKNKKFPCDLWAVLINEWPEETNPRLFCVFLNRLSRLPACVINKNRQAAGHWFLEVFPKAFVFDRNLAWKTFDHLLGSLVDEENDPEGEKNQIVVKSINAKNIPVSRRTYGYASMGPFGKAIKGLLEILSILNLNCDEGLPVDLKDRLEHLVAIEGEGADHAVAALTHQIGLLHFVDSKWVKCRILPWFDFSHSLSEPAWSGYLFSAKIPSADIGKELKPYLLELIPEMDKWNWDRDRDPVEVVVQMVIDLSIFRTEEPDGLSSREARNCLRRMNDKNRRSAVLRLREIGQRKPESWVEHIIPFINTTWPRERAFRTEALVSAWVSTLCASGDKLPEVLLAVRKFLVPIESASHSLHQFTQDEKTQKPLTIDYPDSVLELMDAITPNAVGGLAYELPKILSLIEDVSPKLTQDRRFLRLINLVDHA